jgi:hypothetical protein
MRQCELAGSAPFRAKQHSWPAPAECRVQAIAKAEAVRGNAARLVGTPTLCLCKTPRQDGLAARILFVPWRACRRRGPRRVAARRSRSARYVPEVFFSDAEARGICQPCRHPSRELAVHHLAPVSEGGGNSWGNAMVVCPDCHRELHKH